MAISNTLFTANSRQITITNEIGNGSTNIISNVETAITSLGWSLWDSVDTTTYNPIVTKVYRAVNVDGATFKYFIIRYDTVKCWFNTSASEAWNTTTKVATNETWNNAGAFVQGYDLVNSRILVSASARHIMLWNFINNQPGLWTAVFEHERIAPEDIAANTVPCFTWTNSVMMGTPFGVPPIFPFALMAPSRISTPCQPSQQMLVPPRAANGDTGVLASAFYNTSTNRGPMPPKMMCYGERTIPTNLGAPSLSDWRPRDGNYFHLASYGNVNVVYGWDTTKAPVSYVVVDSGGITVGNLSNVAGQDWPFGRIYNVNIGRGMGNIQVPDTSFANLDVTGGWVSSTGANTEVILLPLNGGVENNLAPYTSSTFSNIFANIGPSVVPSKALAVGDTVFISANAGVGGFGGILTTSISSGQGAAPTFRANIPGGCNDIVFDGNGFVWGTTSNGIVGMNVTTFSTEFYNIPPTIANGCAYISLDNQNLYISSRNPSTAPLVFSFNYRTKKYNPVMTTDIAPHSFVTSLGTPVPMYNGNVLAINAPGTTAGSSLMNVYQWNATLPNPNPPAWAERRLGQAAGANLGSTPFYDYINDRLFILAPISAAATGSIRVEEFYSTNIASVWGTQITFRNTLSTYNPAYVSTLQPGAIPPTINTVGGDARGELYIIPWRGHHYVGVKRPGMIGHDPTGLAAIVDFGSWWNVNPTYLNFNKANVFGIPTSLTIFANANTISTNPIGVAGCITTNGVSLYSVWGNIIANPNDNRVYYINGLFTANTTTGANVGRILLKG